SRGERQLQGAPVVRRRRGRGQIGVQDHLPPLLEPVEELLPRPPDGPDVERGCRRRPRLVVLDGWGPAESTAGGPGSSTWLGPDGPAESSKRGLGGDWAAESAPPACGVVMFASRS